MNILYVASIFPKQNENSNIYTDLAEKLVKKHKVTVLVSEEKRKINDTVMSNERGMDVLRVKTGNLYNVSFVEKGITFVTMQSKIKKAIKKYLSDRNFDLILFMAPPVTFGSVVKYAMKKYNAISYLMQKDIFPQNSLDLGIMSRKNPMYFYFKNKEKNMYKTASVIGCMSQGNIDYLLAHNSFLNKEKLELFPNTISLKNIDENVSNVREKYGISKEKVLAMYGGNFGKPQGIEFIKKVLESYKDDERVVFFFSGKGTEKENLFDFIKNNGFKNVITQDYIPREDYLQMLKETDIGLVFLDNRFTIPNIPSRTLSYFEYSIPIMAATDKNTDYKDFITTETKSGMWCESKDVNQFKSKFDVLLEDKNKRIELGRNGRKYLEDNLTTEKSVQILERAYERLRGEK